MNIQSTVLVSADDGRAFHPLADHMTNLRNLTEDDTR